jgi:hypothetical protein
MNKIFPNSRIHTLHNTTVQLVYQICNIQLISVKAFALRTGTRLTRPRIAKIYGGWNGETTSDA